MTFQLFDTIAFAMQDIFGGIMLLPLILIGVIAVIILSIKGGKVAFFIIIIPMVTAIFVGGITSGFFGLSVDSLWVPLAGWMAAGFVVAGIFWAIIR